MGERIGAYRILVWNTKGKIPRGRPRRRWEDNIKMVLQEGRWIAWTGLIWLRKGTGESLVNSVTNVQVPKNTRNFLISLDPISFLKSTLLHGVSKLASK
jgi:hypothetical protein